MRAITAIFTGAIGALTGPPSITAATAQVAEPIAIASLSPYVGRLVSIEATIGGHKGRFLLDTGGGVTALAPDFAKSIGCTPYGEVSGFRMTGERVRAPRCGAREIAIGKYRSTVDTWVIDLPALLPKGVPSIDGLIALDAFDGQVITLDLGDRQLIIESPQSVAERTSGDKPAAIRLSREMGGMGLTAFASISAKTGELWFLIDSANLANVLASRGALAQWGFSPAEIDQALKSPQVEVPVAINGAANVARQVTARDLIYDGALNEEILFHFNVTMDLKQQRAWYKLDVKSRGR